MTMTATAELPAARRRILRKTYGLEPEEYNQLLVAQGNACAICQKSFTTGRPPATDHDHRNYCVRGLLCQRCNYQLLGTFGDDPALYERVVMYLLAAPADALRDGEGVRMPDAPPPAW